MENKINQPITEKSDPKKRVLFLITQSEFGGAQRFVSQLVSNLDSTKFDCIVVSGCDGNQEFKKTLPPKTQYIVAKHLKRNPSIFNDIASVFELKKIISEFRPEVLFLNSSKAGFNGTLAAKLLPKTSGKPRIIYRIGGWSFNDPRPQWKNFFYKLLEKISAPWKDVIIVNNKHDYDQAIKYGIKPLEKLVLIHNGIDPYKLEFLDKDTARIRLYELIAKKQGSFLNDGLTIGTIANFYPTKGLEYLIEAIRLLKNNKQETRNKLVIIGDGPERESLELQIKDAELQNGVFLTGRIPEAFKYLPAFDIFVLPSVKEGSPWALLEAMSAKLPVIATSVGANPEIIENKKNGLLVQPTDPQVLAEAIAQLTENEPIRRELGIQAHQTIIHKFPVRKMVEEVETLL